MKKNVASQSVGAEMITAADGTAFTGTVTVLITIDNGTQSASGGTAPAHEGNGYHSYTPTQAETNGDHVAFTFTGTGAIPATVQVYTTFPQTGDNFARLGAPAGASVSADIADLPTVSEFNARTLVAASYFDPAADTVANVTTVATTTTNTDMRGTDSALLAASINLTGGAVDNVTTVATTTTNTDMRGTDSAFLASNAPTNFGDLAITVTTGQVTVGTNNDKTGYTVSTVSDKTGYSISGAITTLDGLNNFNAATDAVANVTLCATTTTNTDMRGTDSALLAANINLTGGAVDNVTTVATTTTNTDMVAEPVTLLTTQMTEAYAADAVAPTLAQSLFNIQQNVSEFSIAGTTITTKKIDGTTTAATYTLDDGTNPTSRTRAT